MTMKYIKNIANIKYDKEKCIGCGMCTEVCPRDVFDWEEEKAVLTNRDNCIECGACSKNCPVDAIEVKIGVG